MTDLYKQIDQVLTQYGNYCARHYMHNSRLGDLSIDEAREQLDTLITNAVIAELSEVYKEYPSMETYDYVTARIAELRTPETFPNDKPTPSAGTNDVK